jgi:nitrate reductase NapE component
MLALGVGILVSIVISTIVIAAISGPLHALLGDVCESERRSRFWKVFLNVILFLTPMLAVIVVGLAGVSDGTVVLDAGFLRRVLGSVLAGVFVALVVIAFRLTRTPSARQYGPHRAANAQQFWGEQSSAIEPQSR